MSKKHILVYNSGVGDIYDVDVIVFSLRGADIEFFAYPRNKQNDADADAYLQDESDEHEGSKQ